MGDAVGYVEEVGV
jgi:hypothetical protein